MSELQTITDRSDPAIQRIADLSKPSRNAPKTVLIEDEEPLLQSLTSDVEFTEIYGLESHPVPKHVREVAAEKDVPVRLVGTDLARTLFPSDKRAKLFGVAKVPRPVSAGSVLEREGDVVVLDAVSIVGNIGAIVRTAYAFGAAGIVLVDSGLTTIADRRLIRASRGYVFSLPIALASADQAVPLLHSAGRTVVALDGGASESVRSIRSIETPLSVVLGGEKRGMTPAVKDAVDRTVAIEISEKAESLNVSVAAGIALFART